MTMISEQHVKMAAKLYEARDTMRAFHAGNYSARIREFLPYVNLTMQREGVDVLPAAISVMKQINDAGAGSGMDQLLIMALAVEMTEGELALPSVGTVVRYRAQAPGRPDLVAEGKCTITQHLSPRQVPAHLRMPERVMMVELHNPDGTRTPTMLRASEVISE